VVVDGVPVAEEPGIVELEPPVMWNGKENWKVGDEDLAVESSTILNP
jgi:hypothetical protein